MRTRTGRHPKKELTFKGETKFISDWAYQFGLTVNQVNNRLKIGWPLERVFSEPISEKKQKQGRKNMIPYTHPKKTEYLGLNQKMECVVNEKKIREDLEKTIKQIKENAFHKLAINKAIYKVLEMRECRFKRIQNDYDHREEVNFAIARVLEMRSNRLRRIAA